MDRRSYLAAAATAASLSGCVGLQSDAGDLDLAIFNQTAVPYTVYLEVLQPTSGETLQEAAVYDETVDVEAGEDFQREAVADVARYLVRYDVFDGDGRRRDQDHVHYYPPDGGGDGSIAFDIVGDGTITRRELR